MPATESLRVLFASESYTIKEDADGALYVTSAGAESDVPVGPDQWRGSPYREILDAVEAMRADGVPAEVADRYLAAVS
jgi:hypothetical protein